MRSFLSILMLAFLLSMKTTWANPGGASLSFSSNNLTDQLVETCQDEVSNIIIRLDSIAADTMLYVITRSGMALDSIDYLTQIPDTIRFLPGQISQMFLIEAIPDTLMEGEESLKLELIRLANPTITCDVLFLKIRDSLNVQIEVLASSDFCYPNSILLTGHGANTFIWSAQPLFSDFVADTILIDTLYNNFIYLKGIGTGCMATDSVYISVSDPSFDIRLATKDSLCIGADFIVDLIAKQRFDSIRVFPDSILMAQDSLHFEFAPTGSGYIRFRSFLDSCSFADSVFVFVENFSLTPIIQDTSICSGDTISLAGMDTTGSIVYAWMPGHHLSDSAAGHPLAYPPVTTVYQRTAISRSGLCSDTSRVSIEVIDRMVDFTLLDSFLICPGGQSLARVSVVDSNAIISVQPPVGVTIIDDSILFKPDHTTDYRISIDFEQCDTQIIQTIQVLDTGYFIQILSWDTICKGASVTTQIKVNHPDAQITWSDSQDVTKLNDTIYLLHPSVSKSLTYTIDFGVCTTTGQVDVFVIENQVNVRQLSPSNVCLGDTMFLSIDYDQKNGRLFWNHEQIVHQINDTLYAVVPSDSVELVLNIDFLACSFSKLFNIQVIDPSFDLQVLGLAQLCKGDTLGVDLLTVSEAIFNITPNRYARLLDKHISFFPRTSSLYTITADFGACKEQRNVEITVDSLPDLGYHIIPDKSMYCIDDQLAILPNNYEAADYPDIFFNWSPTDTNLLSDPNLAQAQFCVKQPGRYIRMTTNGSCIQRDTLIIATISKEITSNVTDTVLCTGETFRFLLYDNDLSGFNWTPSIGLSCTDCPNPIVTAVQDQTYTLSYQRNGCTYTKDIFVSVTPVDTIIFPAVSSCTDSMVTFNIDHPRIVNGQWDYDPALSCTECLHPTLRAEESGRFIFRETSGPCELIGIQDLIVHPGLSLSIRRTSTGDIFLGQSVEIIADYVSANPVSFQWSVNGMIQTSSEDHIRFTTDTFNYVIGLTMTDDLTGCQIEDQIEILVNVFDKIRFPNTFTPNGDGINDIFRPAYAESFRIQVMKIINRWGQTVYLSTDEHAVWDGTNQQGQALPSDTYIYIVRLARPNGTIEDFRGDITLVR